MDDILISLVRTRYTNLSEYKLKIRNDTDLPSYIRTLLVECNYWSNLTKLQIEEVAPSPTKLKDSSDLQHKKQQHKLNLTYPTTNSNRNDSSSESVNSIQSPFDVKLEKNTLNSLLSNSAFSNLTDEKYADFIQSRK